MADTKPAAAPANAAAKADAPAPFAGLTEERVREIVREELGKMALDAVDDVRVSGGLSIQALDDLIGKFDNFGEARGAIRKAAKDAKADEPKD